MWENGERWGRMRKSGKNDMASSKITKSPRRRPSGQLWTSFPCIPRSNAVSFFMLLDLIARLSSFENRVAVAHFLFGSVITFIGRCLIPL